MKVLKIVFVAIIVIILLAAAGIGFYIYRMGVPREILTHADGVKYVDFKPGYASLAQSCLPAVPDYPVAQETFVLDGYQRSYYYYRPAKLGKNPNLVFAIHGSAGDGLVMRGSTAGELERLADQHGFVVVYPNGFDGGWNDLRKQSPHAAKRLNIDDVAYFKRIIDIETQRAQIDREQVFYLGHSNGGQMILRLLVEAPEIVTAAATVGANLPVEEYSRLSYENLQDVPVMFVHGTQDSIVPYQGGEVTLPFGLSFGWVYSTPDTVEHWVAAAGIEQEPVGSHIDRVEDDTSVDVLTWNHNDEKEVRLYSVNGGGHGMPMPLAPGAPGYCSLFGGASHDINTVVEAWEFWSKITRFSDRVD
jgi:polyhydroxybutyrate depolymerase